MFIQLDSLKTWRTTLCKEDIKARRAPLQAREHHLATLEKLRLDMQETINFQDASLTTLCAGNTRRLQQINHGFDEMEDLGNKRKGKEEELQQLNGKFEFLESQLDMARRRRPTRRRCVPSLMLWECNLSRRELSWRGIRNLQSVLSTTLKDKLTTTWRWRELRKKVVLPRSSFLKKSEWLHMSSSKKMRWLTSLV